MRNMKKKTALVIGIIGTLLVFGAAVALAQNTSAGQSKATETHECTPEMMENMPEKCPEQMMQSGECENMMNGEKDCDKMMGSEKPAKGNSNATGENHCEAMGSDMGSMMGSGSAGKKGMM
jgi:hypothetical protein